MQVRDKDSFWIVRFLACLERACYQHRFCILPAEKDEACEGTMNTSLFCSRIRTNEWRRCGTTSRRPEWEQPTFLRITMAACQVDRVWWVAARFVKHSTFNKREFCIPLFYQGSWNSKQQGPKVIMWIYLVIFLWPPNFGSLYKQALTVWSRERFSSNTSIKNSKRHQEQCKYLICEFAVCKSLFKCDAIRSSSARKERQFTF